MGIKLEPAASEDLEDHKHRSSRQRGQRNYKLTDLPFPPGSGSTNLKRWSKEFMPCLIDWAASLSDPFASNSHPDLATAVKENWDQIWPELADCHDDPAIVAAVCQMMF